MKKLLIVSISALALLLSSCSSSSSAISDLRSLTNDIRDHGSEYTVSDWKKVANEYTKIQSRLNKYDYSASEREEIGNLKGQCVKYFTEGVATNAAGKVIGIASEIKGILQGLKK